MRLLLSSQHPRNSTYSTEAGQILYKVDKPTKISSSIATIKKAVNPAPGLRPGPGNTDTQTGDKSHFDDNEEVWEEDEQDKSGKRRSIDSQDAPFVDSDSENVSPVLESNFTFLAQVEFHTFKSTRFRYCGLDVPVSEFFRKEGSAWYGTGRVFKASDGEEYRWNLQAGHVEMVKNDGSKKPLVRFYEYQPSLGPIMQERPATLEVDDSCEPILDEVIMTFIYCHKLRKDRERTERTSAMARGGGVAGG